MSKNYDNWERLVAAVLLREELRRLAMLHSRDTSISSLSSSFNSLTHDHHQLILQNEINVADFNWDRSYFHMDNYHEMTSQPSPAQSNVFLDERTGKKIYTVGARDLKISQGDNSRNWKWKYDANSRLDIRAKIKTRILHPWTVYVAYLIFKTSKTAKGLESAKAVVRFVNDESDRDAGKRAKTVHLQQAAMKDSMTIIKGEIAVERDDGWMEVEIGNFYIGHGDDGEVEARLTEIKKWKTGLVVEGVLFRPTYDYMAAPLVSEQYLSTNVWG